MAHLSDVDFVIAYSNLHWLPGTEQYGQEGIFPGGMERNRDYFDQWLEFEVGITETQQQLLFDPETSGGLLMAVAPDKAHRLFDQLVDADEDVRIIGDVLPGDGHLKIVR